MAVAPLPLLPHSATLLDADISLQDGHILHRSPYSGQSLVVRRDRPVYRGRLRLRIRDEQGDDEMASWLDVHSIGEFGVEVWRIEGGHDLPRLPEITAIQMLEGCRARWTLASAPAVEWLNRLCIVNGRAARVIEIENDAVIVSPGFILAVPVQPDPPATATLRVQQLTPGPIGIQFDQGMSQDITLEVIETPGVLTGRGPAGEAPPENALLWMGGGLRWQGGYLIWNVDGQTENALTWMGGELRWMGAPLRWGNA